MKTREKSPVPVLKDSFFIHLPGSLPPIKTAAPIVKSTITIEYCPRCHWMLRATYFAQEFLTTFDNEIKAVTLVPSETNGAFFITVDEKNIFDRKQYGGFPEIKELKQMIRDIVSPGKSLGHSDTPVHHS